MKLANRSYLLLNLILLSSSLAATPSLTIYNQDFAIVRDTIPLDLQAGVNDVRFSEATVHVQPNSVILRDPTGQHSFQILEQNFRGDPISQALLLNLYEGKELEFRVNVDNVEKIVKGKIIRSGYVVHRQGLRRYGEQYQQSQRAAAYPPDGSNQPIVLSEGKILFRLPGEPIFPELTDEAIVKPTLHWRIESPEAAKFDAELGYMTNGMSWEADYNVVAPEKKGTLELIGWVTLDNQSGKSFPDARIKLMAGDVSRIQPDNQFVSGSMNMSELRDSMQPTVSEKAFDEYHLYTLDRPSTIRDRETKQVEFIRASGIHSSRIYIYDGMLINRNYRNQNYWIGNNDYDIRSHHKVWVMQEFSNTKENHLGIALPKGNVRFYRRDDDGALEFTGENVIDHTPKNEKVRVHTGNAFDLVGERIRTDYKTDNAARESKESFKITLHNHKDEPVEIRVMEHLYRWENWEIQEESDPFNKLESHSIEFITNVPPETEKIITYTVRYTW